MATVNSDAYKDFRHTVSHVLGVMDVHGTAIRRLGHCLYGELHIKVNCQQTTQQSHFISEEIRHRLFRQFPALAEIVVHTDPCDGDETIECHLSHHNFLPAAG